MLSHSHHSLDLGLVGQWLQLMDLDLRRLNKQDHWVRRGLSNSAHEAGMVLHFSPLGQGSPWPFVAGGSGIVLEGDLENFVCLCQ